MRMKLWLITGALFMPFVADAVNLPSMVCREQRVVVLKQDTLTSQTYDSSSLYRFTPKGLYLSDKNRAEYFYNEVQFMEPDLNGWRFTSAHKTFFFDREFKHAKAVHANYIEVQVSHLLCTQTEPGR